MWRIDVFNFKDLDLKLPSGREEGANKFWIAGGKTAGGLLEAFVKPIPNNSDYVIKNQVIF